MQLFPLIITVHIAVMGYGIFRGGANRSFAIASLILISVLFVFGGLTTGSQMEAHSWLRFIYHSLLFAALISSIAWYAIDIFVSVKQKVLLYKNCDVDKKGE